MYLAIETSCDETALALFHPGIGLVGEWVHSQIDLHSRYGGVVPDLASREHQRNLLPLLDEALDTLQEQFPPGTESVREILVTAGPGLAGCLALGLAAANSLGGAWQVPVRGVNHLDGHAWSPFIPVHQAAPEDFWRHLDGYLPHLGLLVSGGNTVLFRIDTDRRLTLLGETVDDAAGEALDKGAKLLGLAYPGGPRLEQAARTGDANAFSFPTGVKRRDDPRFSFAGLKTALRYQLEKMKAEAVDQALPDLAASYQAAVLAQLIRKTRQALKAPDAACRSLGLSGGVANNRRLRIDMNRLAGDFGLPLLAAEPRHSGDNAAMIAFAGWLHPEAAFPLDGGGPAWLRPAWRLAASTPLA
ncbi:MAG: tRNA (adenosine(37)-N6)-threonylcarbamoyltransferase complex transferase subunit TsaD [Opitutales bacterium]